MAHTRHRSVTEVEAFIRQAPPALRRLLRELRSLVREELPEASEQIKWGRPVYTLHRIVCYLAAAEDHVRLGFYRGVELDDPAGLLEGDRKKLRHLKVRRPQDIRRRQFIRLLAQAAALDGQPPKSSRRRSPSR